MTKIILAWIAVLTTATLVYAGGISGRECRDVNSHQSCVKINDTEGN